MKNVNSLLIVLVFGLFSSYCKAQCDSLVIELRNQSQVDDFIKTYGQCNNVKSLMISNRIDSEISNLDSLYMIENITEFLSISSDTTSITTINLDGMKNLKSAYRFYINGINFSGQLSGLEEVGDLGIFNTDTCHNMDCFFRAVPNLNYIKDFLWVQRPFTEEYTPNFKTGSDFTLGFFSCNDSTTMQVLSRRIKPENLKYFYIQQVEDFNLSYFMPLDSLKFLRLEQCVNSDFSALSSLNYIRDVEVLRNMTGTVVGEGLKQIKNVEKLTYQTNVHADFLSAFLPSLESIEKSLSLYSTSLTDLSFFDEVEPPLTIGNVGIGSNSALNDCNTPFLCKALDRYPGSVSITRNGSACTKDEIIQYCITDVDDTEVVSLRIYPNPVSGFVKIESKQQNPDVQLYDIHGRLVNANYDKASGTLDMKDVVNGLYMLEVDMQGRKELHKIVKVE